ncbi:MAG TPA: electron transfer flavoprotein subunit beta/FixA family protein [bacterium]|jgi:electron transfer flavoprotein beta subunit
MKIALLVKYCPDSEAQIDVEDGKLQTSGVKYSVSPYDEYGCEAALQILEKKGDGEIILFSLGPEKNNKGLKDELARGAHRAIHISSPEEETCIARIAPQIAAVLKEENPDVIFCGWKGIDFDCGITGTAVAEVMGLPHVAMVNELEAVDGKIICHRQVDGGEEVIEVTLPAVITIGKGKKEPRYPSLKGIMAAKKKPIGEKSAESLGLKLPDAKSKYVHFEKPPAKQAGKKFEGPEAVAEVVRLLHEEAKIL